MNRTLRDDLGELASLGSSAIDPGTSAERVLATVRQRRRRRPLRVVGAIAACLAVTATGVFATLQLADEGDRPAAALPDAVRGQSIRTLCGQPAPDYLEATASPSIMYSSAADRPAAVGDLDGRDLAAGPLEDRPFAIAEPLPTLFVNLRAGDEDRTVVGPTGYVVVKDGVVVATPPARPSASSQVQTSVGADSVAVLSAWGVQACGQITAEGSYEAGTYTLYGVTRVEDPDAPRSPTGPDVGDPGLVVGPALTMTLVDTDEGGLVRYFGDTARVAVDGSTGTTGQDDGLPTVPGAGLDPSTATLDWPGDITPALQSGTATAQSVVWFSPVQGFGPSQTGWADAAVVQAAAAQTLEHVGYAPDQHLLPLSCQPAAAEALAGVAPTDDLALTFGYAVAFESTDEAALFVDLFSGAFGYEPVQVDGEAACG